MLHPWYHADLSDPCRQFSVTHSSGFRINITLWCPPSWHRAHRTAYHYIPMSRLAFLACTLLSSLVATVLGQSNFVFEDSTTLRAQQVLADSYRIACGNIAKSVSPASQVFYPGMWLRGSHDLLLNPHSQDRQSSPGTFLIGPTPALRYPYARWNQARPRMSARL